jgi:hypothetical protein
MSGVVVARASHREVYTAVMWELKESPDSRWRKSECLLADINEDWFWQKEWRCCRRNNASKYLHVKETLVDAL